MTADGSISHWLLIGMAAIGGLATQPRSTLMAALLCLGLHLNGARRLALITLIGLVAAAVAGLRLESLPSATP